MPKVDDELSRRLRRAERPVDVDGLFEGLERLRSHRERLRRVQAGMLAIAVLAATAGGFVALRAAFDPDGRRAGESPTPVALPANGEIVFSREGADGRSHLYAVQPDGSGLRQVTDHVTNDSQPAVSPDGQTIAYVHQIDQRLGVIATIPIDGGTVTWQTEEGTHQDVSHPAWSPDGSKLAFVGSTVDSAALYVRDLNSGKTQALPEPAELEQWPAHPTWSPDGTRIAFAALDFTRSSTSSDLGVVHSDGTGLQWLVTTTDSDEEAPSWSPAGKRIAFIRPYGKKEGIWTMPATGGEASLVAVASELERDLAWAPDGSSLLVSDGDWIYRVDATPDGDPRDNLVRLVEGHSPSWQPLPVGSEPPATPSPSPSRQPGGRDIGLGFSVCEVSHVGAQFDGLGAEDTAYVATRRAADDTCPSADTASGYVGIDLDEDGYVDESYGPISCEVHYCRAFAAPDLDADVGRHELLVVEEAGSIIGLGIYALGVVDGPAGDEAGIVRIEIGEPGDPEGDFVVGQPVTLSVGGDAGWSYRLSCEDRQGGRVLVAASAFREIDSGGPTLIRETTLAYGELRMIVVDVVERQEPASYDPLGPQPDDLCGTQIPRV